MTTTPSPGNGTGRLWTYRITREFEVSASSEAQAQAMLDDALAGGTHAIPAPVQQYQEVLADGDVRGVLGWRSGHQRGMAGRDALTTRQLSLGVIVWSDSGQDDPTVIADTDPTALARAMAGLLHARLSDSGTPAGLDTLLQESAPPRDWEDPRDVDDWLEALREATGYPAFSFHQIPLAGGTDGTDRTQAAAELARALAHRERQINPAPEAGAREGNRPGPALSR